MSESYAKLFSTIATSTIWSEALATRVVWITMLATADRSGEVQASVPGLARIANVSLEECEAALKTFLSPDPYSRTPEHEGRRIEVVKGGWRLLNHAHYRKKLNAEDRRERKAQWMRDARARDHAEKSGQESPQASTESTSGPSGHITDADAPTDTPKSEEHEQRAREISPAAAACIAMKAAGCSNANPSHPDLLAALAEGVEPQTLADCAREAIEAGKAKPFHYAITVARSRHAEGPKPIGVSNAASTRGSRLSAVDRVVASIAERKRREGGTDIDGTCEHVPPR